MPKPPEAEWEVRIYVPGKDARWVDAPWCGKHFAVTPYQLETWEPTVRAENFSVTHLQTGARIDSKGLKYADAVRLAKLAARLNVHYPLRGRFGKLPKLRENARKKWRVMVRGFLHSLGS